MNFEKINSIYRLDFVWSGLVLELLALAEAALLCKEFVHFLVQILILLLSKSHVHCEDAVLDLIREHFASHIEEVLLDLITGLHVVHKDGKVIERLGCAEHLALGWDLFIRKRLLLRLLQVFPLLLFRLPLVRLALARSLSQRGLASQLGLAVLLQQHTRRLTCVLKLACALHICLFSVVIDLYQTLFSLFFSDSLLLCLLIGPIDNLKFLF